MLSSSFAQQLYYELLTISKFKFSDQLQSLVQVSRQLSSEKRIKNFLKKVKAFQIFDKLYINTKTLGKREVKIQRLNKQDVIFMIHNGKDFAVCDGNMDKIRILLIQLLA